VAVQPSTTATSEAKVTSTARWEEVYEDLLRRIDLGEFKPGDRLPAERDLVEVSGFSRNTVRAALGRLEQEGLIEDRGGSRGRTVRRRLRIEFDMSKFELGAYVDDPDHGVDQWYVGVMDAGWTPRQIVDSVLELEAPTRIAELLQLDDGQTHAARRRRLRLVSKPDDDIPEMVAMIADTWTPLDIAHTELGGRAPLMSPDDVTLPGGIYFTLGFRQVRYLDYIEARMPSTEEAALMRLPAGSAVGQHSRVGIDSSGRRVRVLVQTWAGDRQVLFYEHEVPVRRQPETVDHG
jgi:GntR family transcriptional regulator